MSNNLISRLKYYVLQLGDNDHIFGMDDMGRVVPGTGGWGVEAARGIICLAFVYVSGRGLVPQQGSVRWLFWWSICPKNKCLRAKGFWSCLNHNRVSVLHL